ncbi:3-oxoacyl-ACP synthase III family protein [Spirochaeta dissipatitropha]
MARIIGTGLYAPGEAIDHQELMKLANVEFDAERITEKLGIARRHIAHLRGVDETTADFAEKAGQAALANAVEREPGLKVDDIGLFIVGTDTPEFISPATAILLQGRLQGAQKNSAAFDINASCAGFCTALDTAAAMLDAHPDMQYAMVVGVYNMPAFVRPGDVFGYSIFADGAGAVILKKSTVKDIAKDSGYLAGHFLADGTQWNYVGVYSGGTRQAVTRERLESGEYGLQLLQRLPGDRNVKLWPPVVHTILAKIGKKAYEADHFIFTQINLDVIRQVMEVLEQPMEKTTTVMDRYGYTGSGCIPMALHEAVSEGRIKAGDLVVLVASGAGLAVAANVIRW